MSAPERQGSLSKFFPFEARWDADRDGNRGSYGSGRRDGSASCAEPLSLDGEINRHTLVVVERGRVGLLRPVG
jgi:hypothetical protein